MVDGAPPPPARPEPEPDGRASGPESRSPELESGGSNANLELPEPSVGLAIRRRPLEAPTIRPATSDDLPECAEIWREALDDYLGRLNQPPIPADISRIVRLYEHSRSTDPERFVVAARPAAEAPGGRRLIAFASAVMRPPLWFLSMLFVRPAEQGRGLGRALIGRVAPPPGEDVVRAIGADSVQPISNGLYASVGITPQMPMWYLTGYPVRREVLPELPSGVTATTFERVAAGPPDADGHRRLVTAVDELDAEVAGFAHPQDHRHLRLDNRQGFLYHGPDGGLLGYGYAAASGRVGPLAVRDADLVPAVLGHLVRAFDAPEAYATWISGAAGPAFTELLRAGFRIDGFPVILLWDRPFADWSRYLPGSPGLL